MDTGRTADEILAAEIVADAAKVKKVRTAAKKAPKKVAKKVKVGKRLIKAAKKARKVVKKTYVRPLLRPARLDMRLSTAERAKLEAKAKKMRRTVTSVVLEAIEKMK